MSKVITTVNSIVCKIIGKKLREARINKKVTQGKLALMCGLVNKQSIDHMEKQRDSNRLSFGLLFSVCIALDLEVKDFIPSKNEVIEGLVGSSVEFKPTNVLSVKERGRQ